MPADSRAPLPGLDPSDTRKVAEVAFNELRALCLAMSNALVSRLDRLEESQSKLQAEVHSLRKQHEEQQRKPSPSLDHLALQVDKMTEKLCKERAPITKDTPLVHDPVTGAGPNGSIPGDASFQRAKGGQEQCMIDVDKIERGHDARTTCMVKNIPNKLSDQKMRRIIEQYAPSAAYDFFYLPIDQRQRCNVGYAFINFCAPKDIIPFYQAFHGCDWREYNSNKICEIMYARMQGKTTLMNHFQVHSGSSATARSPARPGVSMPMLPTLPQRSVSGAPAPSVVSLPSAVSRVANRHKSAGAAVEWMSHDADALKMSKELGNLTPQEMEALSLALANISASGESTLPSPLPRITSTGSTTALTTPFAADKEDRAEAALDSNVMAATQKLTELVTFQ